MSSFIEIFKREDIIKVKNLQYDESAFYSFASTILLVAIISLVIIILRRLKIENKFSEKRYKNCNCKACQARLNAYITREHKKKINRTFYFYIILTFVLCCLLTLSLIQVKKSSARIKSFDPFEILEIPNSANTTKIIRAYEILALKNHLDKNPNDNQAKSKFMLINKVYESLTNGEPEKNFEKYGNTDKPGSIRRSIGLPSFVLEKKNHIPILVLFAILFLFIFPSCFLFWFNSENYNETNETGIIVKDLGIFYHLMNENTLLKQMPYILGMAKEFERLSTINSDEILLLTNIYILYKDYMCKHNPGQINTLNKKAICILYAYLFREPLKMDNYQKDLEFILSLSDLLIYNIYDMCYKFTSIHPIQRQYKNFGYSCMQTVFEFSENLHQQISHAPNTFNPFFQLPYFNDNKIRLLRRLNSKVFHYRSSCFSDFLKMDIESRNALLSKEFSNEQIDDINKVLDAIPTYDLKIEVYTEGFDDILVDDEVSIKVTIIRNNLQEGQQVGIAHSLGYSELFEEKVALTLISDKMVIRFSIETINNRVTEHIFNIRFSEPNKVKILCDMISMDYKGININQEFEINVLKNSEKRKQHYKDLEKRQIKKIEPSFFQQLLSSVVPIGGDDDEQEEEEEDDKEEKDKENDKEKKDKEKEEKSNDEKKEEEKNEEKGNEKQD